MISDFIYESVLQQIISKKPIKMLHNSANYTKLNNTAIDNNNSYSNNFDLCRIYLDSYFVYVSLCSHLMAVRQFIQLPHTGTWTSLIF